MLTFKVLLMPIMEPELAPEAKEYFHVKVLMRLVPKKVLCSPGMGKESAMTELSVRPMTGWGMVPTVVP